MSTPSALNLYVGAGEVWFDRFDVNGNSTFLRHMGNVDKLATEPKEEVIDKKSAMTGLRSTLAEVPKGFQLGLAVDMSEWDANNLAIALLGTSAVFTQGAVTETAAQINGGNAIALDAWYDLVPYPGTAINATVTDIKQGATTLVPGVDYVLRLDVGMVLFPSTGAAGALATTWDGTVPAILSTAKKSVVQALNVGKIQGHLRYVSALDQASGPRIQADFWKVNIYPDGEQDFIAEDFGSMKLKGQALIDQTKAAGQQFGRVIYL